MGEGDAVAVKIEKRVAIIGDSIVGFKDGYYTQRLNEYLPGMRFEQFGKTSDTTGGMKARLPVILSGKRYDELIIAGGVNDISTFGGGSEQNWRKNLAAMERNVREMIAIAERNGVKRIVLVEIAPWGGSDNWTVQKGERTLEYNAMLERVTQDVNASGKVGVQAVGTQRWMEDKENPGKLRQEFSGRRMDGSRDWLHPGEAGLRMIAKCVAESAYAASLWRSMARVGYTTISEDLSSIEKRNKTDRIAVR